MPYRYVHKQGDKTEAVCMPFENYFLAASNSQNYVLVSYRIPGNCQKLNFQKNISENDFKKTFSKRKHESASA